MKNLGEWFTFLTICMGSISAHAQSMETVINLKARVSMEKLAADVMNPESSRYGKFYTPEEIRKIAAPTQANYHSLVASLRARGFQIVSESKRHLLITIKGPQKLYEQVFSTRIENITGPTQAHYARLTPQIPSELGLIRSITGLNNLRKSRHRHSTRETTLLPRKIKPHDGFDPPLIQGMYGFNPIYQAGTNGAGQHIAIATYDGFYLEDVLEYYADEDVTPAPKVDVVLFNGKTEINVDSAQETQLDAEFSGSIAPGAQIHVFTSAQNSDAGEVELFTAILDDNRAKVVNYSWGDCEPNEDAQHVSDMAQVFARAVAQGVNVVVASGDSGAEGCPSEDSGNYPKYNATFPASIPYVISVGGTSIVGGGDDTIEESAWDGSSGGVSTLYARPSWQQGLPSPFLMRSIPDVAFNGDPNTGQNALIHLDPGNQSWVQFGGTSIGAPQWSGFLALVEQARIQAGKTSLGYLNPIFYGMNADTRAQTFSDVTRGNNDGYKAVAGWDAVTGWGSMHADRLLIYLKNQ